MSDPAFPHSLNITVPLPTSRYADIIAQALSVDKELSALVQRKFVAVDATLEVRYKATTARMLRVAVNGAFESLGVLLETCQELDVDVIDAFVEEGGVVLAPE